LLFADRTFQNSPVCYVLDDYAKRLCGAELCCAELVETGLKQPMRKTFSEYVNNNLFRREQINIVALQHEIFAAPTSSSYKRVFNYDCLTLFYSMAVGNFSYLASSVSCYIKSLEIKCWQTN
jgi:hypothetical protein